MVSLCIWWQLFSTRSRSFSKFTAHELRISLLSFATWKQTIPKGRSIFATSALDTTISERYFSASWIEWISPLISMESGNSMVACESFFVLHFKQMPRQLPTRFLMYRDRREKKHKQANLDSETQQLCKSLQCNPRVVLWNDKDILKRH